MERRAAVAANHRAWFFAGARAAGGRIVSASGVRAALIPGREMTVPFPRGATGTVVDELLALARDANVGQVSVWCESPDGPPCLGARLVARGFEYGWQAHWMHADLDVLTAQPAPPDGISVGLEDATDPAQDVPYWSPGDAATMDALFAARPRRTWRVVARDRSGVVGQVVFLVAPGLPEVAGIYNMGVNPRLQRKGVGRALLNAAFDAARGLGCRSALLNSAASDFYRKVGFTHVGHGQTWWLHKPILDAGLVAPERVAWVEALGVGDVDALERLPAPGDLDAPLAGGTAPMALAVRTRKRASVDWLRGRGATFGVLDAWDLGWRAAAARLLAKSPELANRRFGAWKITPLHEAVQRGDLALAALLLTARPDLSIKDTQFSGTALGWARHLGQPEIAARIEAASV